MGLLAIGVTGEFGSLARAADLAAVKPMALDRFWAMVATTSTYEDNPARQLAALRVALDRLSTDELLAYESAFDQVMTHSYSWDLWGAAHVVHGGASDDGFEYFRCWLISKGRRVFDKVTSDPDSLADFLPEQVEGVLEFESFAYVARKAWAQKSGKPMNEMPNAAPMMYIGREPSGIPFRQDKASLAKQYPKLWRRFGANPLGQG